VENWKEKYKLHLTPKGQIKRTLNNELKTEIWKARLKEAHPEYDYSKFIYTGTGNKSTITCPLHGDFEQTPGHHARGSKCPSIIAKDIPTFVSKASKVHGGKYGYTRTSYTKGSPKVVITCPTHGDFEQNLYTHLNGFGCAKCYGNNTSDTKAFIKEASRVHNNKYVYTKSEYTGSKKHLIVTCPTHGDFLSQPYHHLDLVGCPKCAGQLQDTLYVLKSSCGVYKIGITTKARLPRRIKEVSESLDFSLVKEVTCTSPRDHETLLHRKFKSKRAFDGGLFDGSTECFNLTEDNLEDLWRYLETI